MQQSLYILVFKNEPLIKVGLAGGPWLRIAALGADRFDLSASYLVQCRDQSGVRTLDRMLKNWGRSARFAARPLTVLKICLPLRRG